MTGPGRRLRVILTGQTLIRTGLPRGGNEDFLAMMEARTRDADVVFTNLESTVISLKGGSRASEHYIAVCDPDELDVLRDLGFNLLAVCNNHTWDLGRAGMLALNEELGDRGISFAGSGGSMRKASAAGILELGHARVGLVAMACGAIDRRARAGLMSPGINEIRWTDGRPSRRDVERNLASIAAARAELDLVVAYIHQHHWDQDWQRTPPWLVDLAHECVDAGASLFVGDGVPILHGVELYRGAPVIYSLGNFVFQSRNYEDPLVFESCVVAVDFVGGALAAMEFLPIQLSSQRPGGIPSALSGIPAPASGQTAQSILKRLHDLSMAFGTDIRVASDTGRITCHERP